MVKRQAPAIAAVTRQQVDDALEKAGFGELLSQQGLRLAQALLPLLPGFINLLK